MFVSKQFALHKGQLFQEFFTFCSGVQVENELCLLCCASMFVNVVCLTANNKFIKIWIPFFMLFYAFFVHFSKTLEWGDMWGFILFSPCAKVNAIRPSQTFYFADSGMLLLLLLHFNVIVI
jgi:hypothetical protein